MCVSRITLQGYCVPRPRADTHAPSGVDVDVTEMLGRADGDVMAVAAARGYVLAPWDRTYAEARGRVLCYPEHAPPGERDAAVAALLVAAEEDGRASRVRLISAG